MNHRQRSPSFPASRFRLFAALIILCAGAIGSPAIGQEPAATETAEGQELPASATAALVARLDEINSRLLEINEHLRRPAQDLAGITVALPDRTEQAREVLGELHPARVSAEPAPEVEAALEKMRTLDRIFSRWRTRLQEEVQVLDPWRESLRRDATELEVAAQPDAVDDLPAPLRTRLAEAGREIEATLVPLRRRLDAVVAADVRVGTLQAALRDMAAQVEAAQETTQQQPLARTAPALWDLPERLQSPLSLLTLNGRTRLDNAREYLKSRPAGMVAAGVLFLLLLLAVSRLRDSILAQPSTEGRKKQLLVNHPLAVSILLWTVFVPYLVLPEMPMGLTVLRAIVNVAILWRVLPGLVPAQPASLLRSLLLLAAVFVVQAALLGDPWYGRLVTLAVGGIALLLFRRMAASVVPGATPRSALLAPAVKAAPWVLALGLLAEIAGARVLGQQAIAIVLLATLIACTLIAVDAILRGLLDAFVSGPGARWFRGIRTFPDLVRRRGRTIIRILLALLTISLLPGALPALRPVWRSIGTLLEEPFEIGSVALSPGGVLWFVVSLVLALTVARFVRFVLNEDVLPRLPIPVGTASAASRLIYYAVAAAGIVFALAASGLELTKLTIVVSALSVGIGFGLQNVVNNFVSGIVIAFERPFREGDQIALGATNGTVTQIGLRATRIRTGDGADVIVPNGNFISGEVTNWTLSDRARRVEVKVLVAGNSDPRQVHDVLAEAIGGLEGVGRQPPPVVMFRGFSANSLEFAISFWVPDQDRRTELENEARYVALDALGTAGIRVA